MRSLSGLHFRGVKLSQMAIALQKKPGKFNPAKVKAYTVVATQCKGVYYINFSMIMT